MRFKTGHNKAILALEMNYMLHVRDGTDSEALDVLVFLKGRGILNSEEQGTDRANRQ
jgi:hypothetical protein